MNNAVKHIFALMQIIEPVNPVLTDGFILFVNKIKTFVKNIVLLVKILIKFTRRFCEI